MAVISVQVLHAIVAEMTSTTLRKSVGYRVVVNNQSDGPDVIIASGLLPIVNSSAYTGGFIYGNDAPNSYLICRSISNFRKVVKWSGEFSVWELDSEFFYDRDQHPAIRGVKVEPVNLIESEVVEFAEFNGWYKPKTSGSIGTSANLENDTDIVDADVDTLDVGKIGPVTNSAGTPVKPPPERMKATRGFIINWLKESYINPTDFLDCVNDDEVTIEDSYSSLSEVFAAGELRVVEYSQTPVDIYGVRFFDTTTKLEVVEFENDHFEFDRGLAEYVESGDPDGNGGFYDGSAELPANNMRPITVNGQPITQPIPFNGKGKAIELFQPQKARYLRWKINPEVDFGLLEIGDYT